MLPSFQLVILFKTPMSINRLLSSTNQALPDSLWSIAGVTASGNIHRTVVKPLHEGVSFNP
jgi:hypothetical protein